MDLVTIVQRYQSCDPATGRFTAERSDYAYAKLLGLNATYISRLYRGQIEAPYTILRPFLRRFPMAGHEVATWLASDAPAYDPALHGARKAAA